ncbi:hypothetical protein QWZ03_19290 [Chitinimonas viridis]|uniref:Uncharacterized protein n=1 Tax=Chitinimonas viridis TaxID=664880 RepID=A0ABT8B9T7_9NEIS|nr:hypothetical protein [Chitinimonas viridis]MDN3578916.1 hypothetical protein [Chitinimonas viridis]
MTMKLVCILLTLFFSSCAWAEKPAFEYAGLNIDTTEHDLRKRYAKSNFQISSETKSYYVWVDKSEVNSGIYAIKIYRGQAYWSNGVKGVQPVLAEFKWLNLNLEKPYELLGVKPKTWEAEHYARHPNCMSVLMDLSKKYGSPSVGDKSSEESLEVQGYKWTSGDEDMVLNCYTLRGKGRSLAAEITLSKPVQGVSK